MSVLTGINRLRTRLGRGRPRAQREGLVAFDQHGSVRGRQRQPIVLRLDLIHTDQGRELGQILLALIVQRCGITTRAAGRDLLVQRGKRAGQPVNLLHVAGDLKVQ